MRINLVAALLVITATIALLLLVPLSATSQSSASKITVSDADARFDSAMSSNPSVEGAIRHPIVVGATGADSIRTVSLDTSQIEARPAIRTNARIQVQGADDVRLLGFTNPFVGEKPLPQSPTEIPAPAPTDTPPAADTPPATDTPPAAATDIPPATDTPPAADTPLPPAADTPLPPTADTPLPPTAATDIPPATDTPIPPPIDTPLPEPQPTQAPTQTPIIANDSSDESSAWEGFYGAAITAIIGGIAAIIVAIIGYKSTTRTNNP